MSEPIDITEAWGLVTRLAQFAQEHRLNDAQLVRKLPMLGSARSWRRLAAQDWAAMPVDQWVPKLRAAVAQIDPSGALNSQLSTFNSSAVPSALVLRHLGEAEQCRRTDNLPLARGHCRAARQAIESFQRTLV